MVNNAFLLQRKCKPNAMEFTLIAEAMPFFCKDSRKYFCHQAFYAIFLYVNQNSNYGKRTLFNACYSDIIKFIHIIDKPFIVVAALYFYLNVSLQYFTL